MPAGTVIPPWDFRLVWADNQPSLSSFATNGDLHVNFQLSMRGEAIALTARDRARQHAVTSGAQAQSVWQGLLSDGAARG